MNTLPSAEPPDVAELRRLAEGADDEYWYSDDELRSYIDHDKADVDVPFILAASPDAVRSLLDRLAHMTESRDNARAEVERLTALVAETNEPHPDSPNCVIVGGKGVRVTATDLETGESESVVIDNDYVLICAGDRYQSGVQRHANGTTVLTVKTRKHLATLDGGSES